MAHVFFWLLVMFGALASGGAWEIEHGILFMGAGILMLVFRPGAGLPRVWWGLGAVFLLLGCGAFLPVEWFEMPEWRRRLEELGLETGGLWVVQVRLAAEMLAVFAVTLVVGLWLAGQRVSSRSLGRFVLLFAFGVAGYAVVSRMALVYGDGRGTYGFFPNRNHTATFLAMGAVCGMAAFVQAVRDRKWAHLAAALVASAVCFWAVLGWSESRAGLLLAAVGALGFLGCLGFRYLGRNSGRAVALLVVLVAGGFLIADTVIKERIAKTAEKAALVEDGENRETEENWGGKGGIDPLAAVDFRVPVWRDTLGMIGLAPWTGYGAGQFASVYPQFRDLSVIRNQADSVHPESDWLWLASELGVPATLALAALLVVAGWRSFRWIRHGKRRALRAGCLVAALLVAVHGLVDVPGHRLTIAWAAAWLFSLSLPPDDDEKVLLPSAAWPFRVAGAGVLAFGAWIFGSFYADLKPAQRPAFVAGDHARHEAMALYEEDRKLQAEAEAAGQPYQPAPADDPLETGLAGIGDALEVRPLDRSLYHIQGFLALHYDDKTAVVERAFAMERALDPTWVGAPLIQARAWSKIDPKRTVALWNEALRRARAVEERDPATPWGVKGTLNQIARQARGNPALEEVFKRLKESLEGP